MSQEDRGSGLTNFKPRSVLAFEDRAALAQIARELKALRLIAAAKTAYWWAIQEGWRFSPVDVWRRSRDRKFDREYGVDTITRVEIPSMSVTGENARHGVYYQASPVAHTRHILRSLPIDYSQWTFIDVGSGKGRVLMLAGELPFSRVVGLEFGREVHEVALRNLAAYPHRQQFPANAKLLKNKVAFSQILLHENLESL